MRLRGKEILSKIIFALMGNKKWFGFYLLIEEFSQDMNIDIKVNAEWLKYDKVDPLVFLANLIVTKII